VDTDGHGGWSSDLTKRQGLALAEMVAAFYKEDPERLIGQAKMKLHACAVSKIPCA
jgi:hypothetical protein